VFFSWGEDTADEGGKIRQISKKFVNLLFPNLFFTKSHASEKRHRRAVLFGDANGVVGNGIAQIFFNGRRRQDVIFKNRRNVFYCAMY
jgi:hypothetical protein